VVGETTANLGHLDAPGSITRFFLSEDEVAGGDLAVETGSRARR
jgi:hypothetical protein